jgi:hypothetical protein
MTRHPVIDYETLEKANPRRSPNLILGTMHRIAGGETPLPPFATSTDRAR